MNSTLQVLELNESCCTQQYMNALSAVYPHVRKLTIHFAGLFLGKSDDHEEQTYNMQLPWRNLTALHIKQGETSMRSLNPIVVKSIEDECLMVWNMVYRDTSPGHYTYFECEIVHDGYNYSIQRPS